MPKFESECTGDIRVSITRMEKGRSAMNKGDVYDTVESRSSREIYAQKNTVERDPKSFVFVMKARVSVRSSIGASCVLDNPTDVMTAASTCR